VEWKTSTVQILLFSGVAGAARKYNTPDTARKPQKELSKLGEKGPLETMSTLMCRSVGGVYQATLIPLLLGIRSGCLACLTSSGIINEGRTQQREKNTSISVANELLAR